MKDKTEEEKAKEKVQEMNLKDPKLSEDAKIIEAHYNTWEEWEQDPIGYWLFQIDHEKKEIQAGFCKEENQIETMIKGDDAEEIYNTIIREELVTTLQHAAYIGHELKKAEIALKLGIKYVQDKKLYLKNLQDENRKDKSRSKKEEKTQ